MNEFKYLKRQSKISVISLISFLLIFASCTVNVDPEGNHFECKSDGDCSNGFKCIDSANGSKVCVEKETVENIENQVENSENATITFVNDKGGTITSVDESVSIQVPEGAVKNEIHITVEPATDIVSDDTKVLSAYEFGPDGFQFEVPVTITFKYDEQKLIEFGLSPNDLVVALYKDGIWNEGESETLDPSIENKTISAKVTHFSVYGLIESKCKDLDNDGFGLNCEKGNDCNDGNSNINPDAVELCDGVDNNCDNTVDEGCACETGEERDCYTGESATEGVGICKSGNQKCIEGQWGECEGQVLPVNSEECQNHEDDNCNGEVDEDCGCASEDTRPCYTGPENTSGIGICKEGVERCVEGEWQECEGEVIPAVLEECDNEKDDDCDGNVDEECVCTSGDTDDCYSGSVGTAGIGRCLKGTTSCVDNVWTECVDEVLPSENEDCNNNIDDNCNGEVDENCSCEGDSTESCYTGSEDTEGIGECKAGARSCEDGIWSSCNGEVVPAEFEECNLLDDDCDGEIDEDAVTAACYTGPAGTVNNGICKPGKYACNEGYWGACEGAVTPEVEVCDGIDNDCDGLVDEEISGEECGTDVGQCEKGTYYCIDGIKTCIGRVEESTEICDGIDNNCDGEVDEDVYTTQCYTGPVGTANQGICKPGFYECVNGLSGNCVDQTLPEEEVCDDLDNDCDGNIDEILIPCGTDEGACSTGLQGCDEICNNAVEPVNEVCDGIDNDCDGLTDEADDDNPISRNCGDSIGACVQGTQICELGSWSDCSGAVLPSDELCDGVDNDCDGTIDEGITTECGSNVGVCQKGISTCLNGEMSDCQGNIEAVAEFCTDGLDNNCDGKVDENCNCTSGDTQPCGEETGACEQGEQLCTNDEWGPCQGAVGPADEVCDNVDNDCDGDIDESLTKECGRDVGACNKGVSKCEAGTWSSVCEGEIISKLEVCDNIDNDCDGNTDEEVTKVCGATDVGECSFGTSRCSQGNWEGCEGEIKSASESCNNKDDDCDGLTDESLEQKCGSNTGECDYGTQKCSSGQWGSCENEVTGTEEICDNKDNDCDGLIDDDIKKQCGTDLGECKSGYQRCIDGGWNDECIGELKPSSEVCDGKDNNCDGTTDESLSEECGSDVGQCVKGRLHCINGQMDNECRDAVNQTEESCDGKDNDCDGAVDEDLTLPVCSKSLGVCTGKLKKCGDSGWVDCSVSDYGLDFVEEEGLAHCDRKDNDCDGTVDEGCQCENGATQPCGSDIGACVKGVQTCTNGDWGACVGETKPGTEICDGKDNNCDGKVDEDIIMDCYTGVESAINVGICHKGKKTCKEGTFGECLEQILPSTEVCDGKDNDCDGKVDEDESGNLLSQSCGISTGECQQGKKTCIDGSWSGCEGNVNPADEICDGKDNDCNGHTDDNVTVPSADKIKGVCAGQVKRCNGTNGWVNPDFASVSAYQAFETQCDELDNDCDGLTDESIWRDCYDADASTKGVGICHKGTQQCVGKNAWSSCSEQQLPVTEVCDGVDNDCDGAVDEGLGSTTCGKGICTNTINNCKDGETKDCDPFKGKQTEVCDSLDNDCDGFVDENLSQPVADKSLGVCSGKKQICDSTQKEWVEPDYTSITAYQSEESSCDGLDNDCDGEIDKGLTAPAAAKTTGVCTGKKKKCDGAEGWNEPVYNDISSYQVTETLCDGLDNDCDGYTDNGLAIPNATKQNGVCNGSKKICSGTGGFVDPNYTAHNSVYQVTESTCDGLDNDCDGEVDETNDEDNDGYTSCQNDCADSDDTRNPGVSELCNGIDDNCDGDTDETWPELNTVCTRNSIQGTYICEADGLGTYCDTPSQCSSEVCDGLDNDCDGTIDNEFSDEDSNPMSCGTVLTYTFQKGAKDYGVYNLDGEVGGEALTYANGKVGRAMAFNGNAYVVVSDRSTESKLSFDEALGIRFWVMLVTSIEDPIIQPGEPRFERIDADRDPISSVRYLVAHGYDLADETINFGIGILGSKMFFSAKTASGSKFVSSDSMNSSGWVLVEAVYSVKLGKMYLSLNGSIVSSGETSITDKLSAEDAMLFIGAKTIERTAVIDGFIGVIDEFKLYNTTIIKSREAIYPQQ